MSSPTSPQASRHVCAAKRVGRAKKATKANGRAREDESVGPKATYRAWRRGRAASEHDDARGVRNEARLGSPSVSAPRELSAPRGGGKDSDGTCESSASSASPCCSARCCAVACGPFLSTPTATSRAEMSILTTDEVAGVLVELPEATASLVKVEGQWQMIAPQKGQANPRKNGWPSSGRHARTQNPCDCTTTVQRGGGATRQRTQSLLPKGAGGGGATHRRNLRQRALHARLQHNAAHYNRSPHARDFNLRLRQSSPPTQARH